jgi:hypothetical protein
MHAAFSRLVDGAADIAASGRWAAVNERIKQLATHPGPDNAWWVEIFTSLCAQTFSEYLALKRAHEEHRGDASLLAWRARNLLELSVWALYCAKSRDSARRLFEDAGRDARELIDAFTKWGRATAQDSDWLDSFTGAKLALSERAASEGVDSLDGSFKPVSQAAQECGMGHHFSLSFKTLSKFAHPTAMLILAPPDKAKTNLQKDMFFSQGCLYFTGAFVALEDQLIQ